VRVFWLYLGEKGGKHYYVSKDKHAGVVAPQYFEDSWDYSGERERYLRVIDEVCERARSAPYVYVRLPRDSPPLLHLHSNGELWLALDNWPRPSDVLRIGRLPYSGPEAKCEIDYALDIMRRERASGAYIKVVRAPHCTVFCFQPRQSIVAIAERPW
jgi:hypothetical protein